MRDRDRCLRSYYRDLRVAVWQGEGCYCAAPPFHPHVPYPEYSLALTGDERNAAYEGVRTCLSWLNLDRKRYGTADWNPLRDIIAPGDRVLIKPNFVLSRHYKGGNLFAIITHPSVLRAVVDYVYKALGHEGHIIIADAPQMDCDFRELLAETHVSSIQELYWDRYRFRIDVLDLRDFWLDSHPGDSAAYSERRIPLKGDPSGSVLVNLGRSSALCGVQNWDRFYGADYNRRVTIAHHHGDVHEYMISRTALSSHVILSVPKFKVHKKVGVSLNCKGFVGISTNKNLLVHYTLGTPEEQGDQFPPGALTTTERRLVRGQRFLYDALLARQKRGLDWLYRGAILAYGALVKPWLGSVPPAKRVLDGGNWHGNDSAWRMVVDLVRVVEFADETGRLASTPQRRIFSIVDGIIGGENDGPLAPDAKEAGIIMAGFNPVAVDIVGTRLMGFDWRKLKWIQSMLDNDFHVSTQGIQVVSDKPELTQILSSRSGFLNFLPHPGWRGHIDA